MGFDRVAPFYGLLERVGAWGKMQRCRIALLGDIPQPQRVLLVGEGPGRFLAECVRRFPDAEFTVLDASVEMLKRAKKKVSKGKVEWVHAEFPDWDGPLGKFDLIVTNFFLDCFTEEKLAAVIAALEKMAAPAADWLVADFEIAPRGWRRCWSKIVVGALYRFFRISVGLEARALVAPEAELARAGFGLMKRVTFLGGLLKSEWWGRDF